VAEDPDFMGYAAGTRVIRVDTLMFRIDMVRASDGTLKIALVRFYIE
jgi:hypothetical protein